MKTVFLTLNIYRLELTQEEITKSSNTRDDI